MIPEHSFKRWLILGCLLLLPLYLVFAETDLRFPVALHSNLPGLPENHRDESGTPVIPLPEWMQSASLVAYAHDRLYFYPEADDDDSEGIDLSAHFFKTFPRHHTAGAREIDNSGASPEFLRDIQNINQQSFWANRLRPIFVQSLQTTGGRTEYAVSLRFAGLLRTAGSDPGESYNRLAATPARFMPAEYHGPAMSRDVLDLWQNPDRPQELLVVNKHEILFSNDYGQTFSVFALPHFARWATLSTITARTDAEGHIQELFAGTYVRGVFRCSFRNHKPEGCREMRYGLPAYRDNPDTYFIEPISGLVWDRKAERLLAITEFRPVLAEFNFTSGRWETVPLPGLTGGDHAESLFVHFGENRAYIGTNRGIYVRDFATESWKHIPTDRWLQTDVRDDRPQTEYWALSGLHQIGAGRLTYTPLLNPSASTQSNPSLSTNGKRAPENIRAFYVSPTSARQKQQTVMDLIDNYNFNAVVIDVKDDFGRLVYGSRLPEATAMRNTAQLAPLRDLIAKLKAKGVYVIARQVVFKDARAFHYDNNRYAILDRYTGAPWQYEEIERWVDTYAEWIHNYNLRVAREVRALGVDEIQFDYIRFPSDGPIGRCQWRYRRDDAYKSEAIEAFLMKARAVLDVPIGVDIYGYRGIYRVGTVIGQDVIDMGEFADVVSPMHYSSHFGDNYLDHIQPREKRTYELLKLGSERPVRMGQGRFQVRPWLQAFRIKIGIWGYGEPYMQNQILGSIAGGANGYQFWGPIQEFYIPGRVQKELFTE